MKIIFKVSEHTEYSCVTQRPFCPNRERHHVGTTTWSHHADDTTRRQLAAAPRRRSLEVAHLLESYYRSGGFPELRRAASEAQGGTDRDQGASTVTGRASIVPSPGAGGGILENPFKLRKMAADDEWEIWVSAAVTLIVCGAGEWCLGSGQLIEGGQATGQTGYGESTLGRCSVCNEGKCDCRCICPTLHTVTCAQGPVLLFGVRSAQLCQRIGPAPGTPAASSCVYPGTQSTRHLLHCTRC